MYANGWNKRKNEIYLRQNINYNIYIHYEEQHVLEFALSHIYLETIFKETKIATTYHVKQVLRNISLKLHCNTKKTLWININEQAGLEKR